MTWFRGVAKEDDIGSGQFEVSDVKFYEIIKDGIVSANPSKKAGQKVTVMPSGISVGIIRWCQGYTIRRNWSIVRVIQ